MASEWITSTSVRELRTFSCAPNRSRVGAKWPCEKVIVVCNNLNTHTKGAFYEAFPSERARRLVRRIEFCYTPKHGSWLNIAENELSSLTRQCLTGRCIGDIETLRDETTAWSTNVNTLQRGVDWQMKIENARCKLNSVYPKISILTRNCVFSGFGSFQTEGLLVVRYSNRGRHGHTHIMIGFR